MRRIITRPLRFDDEQTVQIPRPVALLCVQMHGDTPALVVLAEDGATQDRPATVFMRHTEDREPLPEYELWYMGSVQTAQGQPWWHVFVQADNEDA